MIPFRGASRGAHSGERSGGRQADSGSACSARLVASGVRRRRRGEPQHGVSGRGSCWPSHGWTVTIKQAGFGWTGGPDDAEGEHDGREPQGDDEPYLAGTDTDLEWDYAEHGLADREGGSEQGFPDGGLFSHVE